MEIFIILVLEYLVVGFLMWFFITTTRENQRLSVKPYQEVIALDEAFDKFNERLDALEKRLASQSGDTMPAIHLNKDEEE
jgi:hypothetical protein